MPGKRKYSPCSTTCALLGSSFNLHLFAIYPMYPLLETWAWWMVIQFSLDCTNFTAQSKRRGERPSDLGKLLPQGHQVLHLPELLHFHPLTPLWPAYCSRWPDLFRQLVEIELQACESCNHFALQSVLQTKIVSQIRPTGLQGWALDQKYPTMQRWSES